MTITKLDLVLETTKKSHKTLIFSLIDSSNVWPPLFPMSSRSSSLSSSLSSRGISVPGDEADASTWLSLICGSGLSCPASVGFLSINFNPGCHQIGAVRCCLALRKKTGGTGWKDWTRCLQIRKRLVAMYGQVQTIIFGLGLYVSLIGIVIGVFSNFCHSHLKPFRHEGNLWYQLNKCVACESGEGSHVWYVSSYEGRN